MEMFFLTGMRHGTEALVVIGKMVCCQTDKGVCNLCVWIDSKTGRRWLIAKHRAVDLLKWLHATQRHISELSFETTFTQRLPHKLFQFSDRYQPSSLNAKNCISL